MRYKELGKSGLNVSQLTIGTWAIGGAGWGDVNKADSIAAIHAMIDNGVNSLDTAPAYNDGESERIVGEALAGIRDKVIITTKCGVYNPPEGGFVKDARPEVIRKQLENSLRYLRTDYVDMYVIHWPDIEHCTPIADTMGELMKMKQEGKIRGIGVSNFSIAETEDAMRYGQVDAVQLPYSMVNRSFEEVFRWAEAHDVGVMTYGSLGSGILTGAIRKMPDFAPDDMRLNFYDFYREPKFSQCMELLKSMDVLAAKYQKPLPQIAINWNIQKSFVTTSLVGVRNVHEANENCTGLAWTLTDEDMAFLDEAIEKNLG